MRALIAFVTFGAVAALPETGEQNAKRFVSAVTRLAADRRIVTMYSNRGWRDSGEQYGWEWMPNRAWRQRVIELLADAPVKDGAFHAPDAIDDWVFAATSIAGVPRVASLTLEEAL